MGKLFSNLAKTVSVLFLSVLMVSGCGAALNNTPETTKAAADAAKTVATAEKAAVTEPPAQVKPVSEIKRDEKAPGDMPAVYIVLDNSRKLSAIPRDDYITGLFCMDGMGKFEDVGDIAVQIKGRGNYSWGLPKKPYNIKFEEKADLLGMGEAKKWTLIANYSDKTLLRNAITLNFSYEAGMEYTSQCEMVNLYINGEYMGVYLLTERIQIHENRVNVDMEKGGALFEIEMKYRHSDCKNCIQTSLGVHLMLVEPEEGQDGRTRADIDAILAEMKLKIIAMEKAIGGGKAQWSEIIDAKSFADWYIVNEFVKNFDSIFVTSCYFFLSDDGRFYMGPSWDFDTCMGNQEIETCIEPTGWYIANATWYKRLLRDTDFTQLVKDRWTELRKSGVIDNLTKQIDAAVAETSESVKLNFQKWPNALKESGLRGGKSLYTYEEEVAYLKNFIKIRTAWLDEQWGYSS